jgi:hypothetical protein
MAGRAGCGKAPARAHPPSRAAVLAGTQKEEGVIMDLGNIRPQMEVVGSDGGHLGTVDHVDHNRIKLRRNDPGAGGQHHWLAQEMIAEVDGNTVRLTMPAAQARQSWQGEAAVQSPSGADAPAGMGGPHTGTGGQSMAHQDRGGQGHSGEPGPRPDKPLPGTPSRDKDRDMVR